jgi:glycosyltransferase involved in cell wall biosynthesis
MDFNIRKYVEDMKVNVEKSVTVITPSVNSDQLNQAVDSVANQTYGNVRHLIVSDGAEYYSDIIFRDDMDDRLHIDFASIPYNTGGVAPGFYGHRIYAAFPHLVNTDYIAFLDEDNWFEPDHIKTLVETIESNNLVWAHSLRNICKNDGTFFEQDNCESIGRWPIFFTQDKPEHEQSFLVDTSSYMFKTDFLIKVCNHWHHGWGGDRRFFGIIKSAVPYGTTGQHTLNYRLDTAPEMKYGPNMDFFSKGNDLVKQHYNGEYPWTVK